MPSRNTPEHHALFAALLLGGLLLVASAAILIQSTLRTEQESAHTKTIVATTGMIGDIGENLAGDLFSVTSLIGPTVDPHLYSATRSDMQKLLDADVVLFNGLYLEGRLLMPLSRLSAHRANTYPLGEALERTHLIPSDEEGKEYDPHIWMDPVLWKLVVQEAEEHLTEHFPVHAPLFREQTKQYLLELDELHEYSTQCLSSIPEHSRILITAHDAFHYFGRRYGFQVLGVQGLSTESEAGLKDIEKLIRIIVEHQVKAIFIESTVSPRNMQALIDGARRKGQEVIIGGELFADAMGPRGGEAGTYLGMIRSNIETITQALGGSCHKQKDKFHE